MTLSSAAFVLGLSMLELAPVTDAWAAEAHQEDPDHPRLSAEQLAAAGPVRVVFVFDVLDEEMTQELLKGKSRIAVETATGAVTGGGLVYGAAMAPVGGAAGASFIVVALPLVLITGGFVANSYQQRGKELDAARAIADPLRERFAAAHRSAEIDRRFIDAFCAELERLGGCRGAGDVVVVSSSAEGDATFDPVRFLGGLPKEQRSSLLVVTVSAKVPDSLLARYVVADVDLYSMETAVPKRKPKYPSTGAPRWQRKAAYSSGLHGLIISPAPLAAVAAKPAAWVEREEKAIRDRFDPVIESTADRDGRRELKSRRNARLDEVRGPWTLAQLAGYMAEQWRTPEGDRYLELVAPAMEEFGRSVAARITPPTP